MKFLEAKRILSEFQDGVALSFLLGMSAESKNLEVFVRAAAAARGYSAHIRALSVQHLGAAYPGAFPGRTGSLPALSVGSGSRS